MNIHRLKHTFTSGEVSPLMDARKDFSRYINGASLLENFFVHTQGPISNRSGFQFIYSLSDLNIYVSNEGTIDIKLVPFIFNEAQTYVLIFYRSVDLTVKMVIAEDEGLIVYPDPVPTECPPGTPATGLIAGNIVSLDLTSSWDIATMDYAQSGDELYITMENHPQHVIKRYSPYCWTVEQISFTNPPASWGLVGYPSAVTFHQQRLIFAGTPDSRQTVWCSTAGDFLNFGTNNPVIDSDSVTFTLDSGTQNGIHWMHSGRALSVGTIGNEWTVIGSTRSALTPSNILAQEQTSMGSLKLKPIKSNSSVVFVGRYGRTIEEFVYNFDRDSYITSDLSILSEHLTKNSSIVAWTYQQFPDHIIWAVREDGVLLGITYQRDHEVVAWHRHTTDGKFLDIMSVPGNDREDEVWAVVERTNEDINGDPQTIYCLEKKFKVFEEESLNDAQFLDSAVQLTGENIQEILGLDHLNGKTVGIFADGHVLPEQEVESSRLSLDRGYSKVLIGLPYTSKVLPNLADIADQEGTSLGRTSRTTQVNIDFYDTVGGFVGRIDPDTGEEEDATEILFRNPYDPPLTAVGLFSGIKDLDFPAGQSRNEQYFIKQTQPLPMTIRAIVDTVEYTK